MQATRRTFLTGLAAASAAGAAGGNLIRNSEFRAAGPNGLPAGWEVVCPNPALAPVFEAAANGSLTARGNGRRECLGYVRQRLRLAAAPAYRMRVDFEQHGLDDVRRQLLHGVFDAKYRFNNGIFEYAAGHGENVFDGPAEDTDVEVRMYFRFSANGRVAWRRISLEPCEPVPERRVTIACREGAMPKGAGLDFWAAWLDEAGRAKAGVALLPEMFNAKTPRDPEPLDGPSANLLARKAEHWKMTVSGSFYERRGDVVFNTAPLFGPDGRLIGTYEKNYPYDPELDDGVTPGREFPVFETPFGKTGIIICYDSWFPESSRMLALRGAELLLFPNAGYYVDLMPARAADNGLWIAVSSLNCPAGVWDSGGARAGEAAPSPTRSCKSSIVAVQKLEPSKMLLATVDMSRRYSPAWHGGPMESAPGARRVRRTRMDPIEDDLAREIRRS